MFKYKLSIWQVESTKYLLFIDFSKQLNIECCLLDIASSAKKNI